MNIIAQLTGLAARRLFPTFGAATLLALGASGLAALPSDSAAWLSALAPAHASAVCDVDPRATGYLTDNGTYNGTGTNSVYQVDTSTGGDMSSATVYAWISQFNGTNDGGSSGTKNCGNPVYRYGGLAWLTNSTTATLDWGGWTTNGSSSSCYPLYGSTDYMHANSTTTCVWTAGGNPGLNYHILAIDLAPAMQYHGNSTLSTTGDFEFVWDSCSTFYQSGSTGEIVKTGVPKTDLSTVVSDTTSISWKPGANCGGALTQDDTGSRQSFWYDPNPPTTSFSAPTGTVATQATSYNVAWTETETGSGIASRSLQRKVANYSGGCGTFGADGAPVSNNSPYTSPSLVAGKCYQWVQTLTDNAGNQTITTSGTVIVDPGPTVNVTTPASGNSAINTTSYSVAWTETTGSGTITSRSLQQKKSTTPVTNGTCSSLTYSNDGTAQTGTSPRSASPALQNGYAYKWTETVTNSNGYQASDTSPCLIVDTTAPTAVLQAPLGNEVDHGVLDVIATASDAATFRDWTLENGAGSAPTSWTTIATGTNQTTAAFLSDWDSRALSGVNTLRLTVRDLAGNTSQAQATVFLENTERGAEPYRADVPFDLGGGWTLAIATDTGEARLTRDLFSIPSFGPSQSLALTYSSLDSGATGRFGVGWASNLTQYLSFESGFIVWHRADGARIPFGQVAGVWTPLAGHFETLAVGTEDVVTLQDQTRLVFDSSGSGRLKRIENRFGKALTMVWGSSSATATDASGRVTNITISAAKDRITSVTDSAGRTWTFEYAPGSGNLLATITDPAGNATNFVYDANNDLISVTRTRTPAVGSAQTLTWSIGYTSGKATAVTDPINSSVANTLTYNVGSTIVGLLKTYSPTVRNSSTYAYTYTGPGWSMASTDPAGFVTTTTYDSSWRLSSMSRPVGSGSVYQLVTYTYDRGNIASETTQLDAAGTTDQVVSTYDGANDLLTRSDADNDADLKVVTLYTYDALGHLLNITANCTTSGTTPPAVASSCTAAGTHDASTNLVTAFSYTSNDQLLDETDPLGHVTRHGYDAFGDETSVIENYQAAGGGSDVNVTTSRGYDQATIAGKAGFPTSIADANGNLATYTYDVLGNRLSEALPGDSSIPALTRTLTYDEFGNVLTQTEAWTGATRVTTHVYDLMDRESSTTDGSGATTSSTYDAAGDPITTTVAGVATTHAFDSHWTASSA